MSPLDDSGGGPLELVADSLLDVVGGSPVDPSPDP